MEEKKDSFWRKIRYKYRLSVMNEDTLTESWHIRLSKLGVFSTLCVMFFFTLAIFAVLIVYTPIRNVLPGYSESLRQQLIAQTSQVDSLSADLELQRQYLDVIKQVVSGEVMSDTIQSLDSMQIVMREQLLEAKNEATEEFVAQYEAKGKDNLQFFDIQQTTPVITFFRPAHGVVQSNTDDGVLILTPPNENVTSVLSGRVIVINYEIDNTYTIMVQHEQFLSIYKHVGRVLKKKGDYVQAGESIGIMSEDKPLLFELWQGGKQINPEEVIAF